MKTSIIIVTYKRPELLKRCLESIKAAKGQTNYEILIIINGKDQKSAELISKFPVKLIQLKKPVSPGEARNTASTEALGEYLLFLDDDAALPPDYFKIAEKHLNSSTVDIFGGPDQTSSDAGFFERAIGAALTSPLATASTRYRHKKKSFGVTGNEQNLILCALWVKKSIFFRVKFDKRFFRNEENVLLLQLHDATIEYDSELWVEHKRKTSIKSLTRAIGGSGHYRMKMFYIFKSPHPLYFVPMLFVIYLILLPLTGKLLFICPLLIYLGLNIILSLVLARREIALTPFIMGYQFLINISYGLGSLFFFMMLLKQTITSSFSCGTYQQHD